jgi:Tfp pilus assembly protein PilO
MKKENKIDFKQLSADPRILVVIIALACAALIGLCVYTAKQTKEVEAQVKSHMAVFEENKSSIENLLKLKARSNQYLEKNEEYEALITDDGLSQQDMMIFYDNFCKQYGCRMNLIEFGEEATEGDVNSLKFKLTVEGKFENLMAVCDGIVTQDRFYRIDGVTFSPSGEDNKIATIDVVAFSK